MTRIGVLYIDHSPIISGATKVLVNLLKMLDKRKVQPIVAVPWNSKITQAYHVTGIEVKTTGMPLLTIRTNLLGFVSCLYYLIMFTLFALRLAREKKVTIIHANGFISALYGLPCAVLSRRQMVWHMHEIMEITRFNKIFIKLLEVGAARIICVSEAVEKRLIEFGVAPGKCIVIYNSVQEVKNPIVRGKIRKELNINENILLVGIVGMITRWKGQLILIKAIPEVIKYFPNVNFVIAGDIALDLDKEYKDELCKIIEEWGIGEKVIFTGFREDILDVMTDLEVLVHTSILPDPLPTVIIEAMSVGRPVIATNMGGCPEMIIDGINGLLVPPNRPEFLSQAICRLLSDPDLRHKYGTAGREIVKDKFSQTENLRKVMSLYQDLIH